MKDTKEKGELPGEKIPEGGNEVKVEVKGFALNKRNIPAGSSGLHL